MYRYYIFFVFWDVLRCTSHTDCYEDEHCHLPNFDLSSTCSGLHDSTRNCELGDCFCIRGHYDFQCDGLPNEQELEDGGWCYDGRRDEFCLAQGKISWLRSLLTQIHFSKNIFFYLLFFCFIFEH